MNSAEFVCRIKQAVYEATIEGLVSLLEQPPGRRPNEKLADFSRWFNALSPSDREKLLGVIQLAARMAVFEMLSVLDGTTAIREANEAPGVLELQYRDRDQRVLLNSPSEKPLHDVFAEQVPLS
jgi:hypothetical protein